MKTSETSSLAGFAERLSSALERKNGGNQSEMARALGCSPQAANKWLSGIQFPRDKMLRKIAEYVEVTPEYLRFGTPMESEKPLQFVLLWVRSDEVEVLSDYRQLTDAGKRQFRAAAQAAERLPPQELPMKSGAAH